MNAWDLIKCGQYEQAVEEYTAKLKVLESSPNYCNLGIAHLNQSMLERALLDFEAAERCRPTSVARSDGSGQWIGTVHWIAGNETKAAQIWLELIVGLESKVIGYTDAAGGVGSGCLLWFAAIWLKDESLLERALPSKYLNAKSTLGSIPRIMPVPYKA